MSRNHIHFTPKFPGMEVISGMRNTCDILIEIDVEKAIKNGIEFYQSKNEVILSRGIN